MFTNRCMDMGEFKNKEFGMDGFAPMNETMPYMEMGNTLPGIVASPIYECPQIKVCHREIIHMVPHVQPVETKIVNHHIYKHSYSPHFTCSEENVCSEVYEPTCGGY